MILVEDITIPLFVLNTIDFDLKWTLACSSKTGWTHLETSQPLLMNPLEELKLVRVGTNTNQSD